MSVAFHTHVKEVGREDDVTLKWMVGCVFVWMRAFTVLSEQEGDNNQIKWNMRVLLCFYPISHTEMDNLRTFSLLYVL